MHPKPADEEPIFSMPERSLTKSNATGAQKKGDPNECSSNNVTSGNLIQLDEDDDDGKDDDIIFEDFARLRLKGETE